MSDRNIDPTRTDHLSLGLYKNFKDNQWESFAELFYKDIRNVIDYKDGADLLFNPNPETELLRGRGRAFGLELFLKKRVGVSTGWISYTLSRAERKVSSEFEEETINGGNFFPDDNDKTHDLSIVFAHRFNERMSLSSSFNYSTGRPVTLPVGKFNFEGNPIPQFSGRNQNRITDYHRLDLSFRLEGKKFNRQGEKRKFL